MKNLHDAEKLAKEMITIGRLAGRETVCVLTNMNEPLGYSIGNSLEVKEAIEALNGNIPQDVKEVVLELGSHMLVLAGITNDLEKAKKVLDENLKNGKAYKKFMELVQMQGGDVTYLSDLENFEESKYVEPVYSEKSGYIYSMDAKEIGKLACTLGAGRVKKEDKIDPAVGIVLSKKVGDYVSKDEVIAYLHINNPEQLDTAKETIKKIIKIRKDKAESLKTIIKIIK